MMEMRNGVEQWFSNFLGRVPFYLQNIAAYAPYTRQASAFSFSRKRVDTNVNG